MKRLAKGHGYYWKIQPIVKEEFKFSQEELSQNNLI